LTLVEALLGYEFAFRHLDDRIIIVKSPVDTVTSAGDLVTVSGEGMPLQKRPFEKGDLYLKFNVVMPKFQELGSTENQTKLRSLLPKAPELPTLGTEREEYTAKPHDEVAQAAKLARDREQQRNSRGEDDDDEGGPRTGEWRTQ